MDILYYWILIFLELIFLILIILSYIFKDDYRTNIKIYKFKKNVIDLYFFISFTVINTLNLLTIWYPIQSRLVKFLQFIVSLCFYIKYILDYLFYKVRYDKFIMHMQLNLIKNKIFKQIFSVQQHFADYSKETNDKDLRVMIIKPNQNYALELNFFDTNYILKPIIKLGQYQLKYISEYINQNLFFLDGIKDLFDLPIPIYDEETCKKYLKCFVYSKSVFIKFNQLMSPSKKVRELGRFLLLFLSLVLSLLILYVSFKILFSAENIQDVLNKDFLKWLITF